MPPKSRKLRSFKPARNPATFGGHERVGEILGVGGFAEQLTSEDWTHARFKVDVSYQ